MKITILGCGSFFVDKDHSAPSYLLQMAGKNILLDCGMGTMNQLAKINFNPLDLDYIFITHFHADHSSDLFPILSRFNINYKSYGGTLKKLKVVGPKGVESFVRSLAKAYLLEIVLDYPEFEFIEFKNEMDFGNFKVAVYGVEHLGIDANALRITVKDKILTYTGDAIMSEGVKRAAKDADLLITDCATPKKYPATAHLGTTQVGEICRDNGVKKVILSHQVPPGYDVDMVGEVKEVWDGDVLLAKDLMEIEL